MDKFDPKNISEDEKSALKNKILSNSGDIDNKGHILWALKPNKTTGYPELKLPSILANRFGIFSAKNPGHMLFIMERNLILNCVNHDMSHLCHNKLCINPQHLNYEPRWVNHARKTCVRNNVCGGHRVEQHDLHFPNCIL